MKNSPVVSMLSHSFGSLKPRVGQGRPSQYVSRSRNTVDVCWRRERVRERVGDDVG